MPITVCCLVFRSFRTMLLFWGRFGGNTLSRYGVPSASHSCFVPKKIPILSNFDKSLVAMFPMSQHFLKSFYCHQFRFFSPNITLSVNVTCFPYCELYSKWNNADSCLGNMFRNLLISFSSLSRHFCKYIYPLQSIS